MLRKGVFWIHLACGVITGLVILMMSVTGVLLTYERQILAWSERTHYYQEPAADQRRLSLDELAKLAAEGAGFTPTSITLSAEPAAPAMIREGRAQAGYMNPYTGEVYEQRENRLEDFFGAVVRWHRWFNAGDESRAAARAVTGISNLAFLFLILSGLYLWLPPLFRWSTFRLRLWFHPNARTGKARDFNWHHVFGIWAAIPLLVIVPTATVFNYSWANNLVFRLAGEEPPQRRGGRGEERAAEPVAYTGLPLEQLFQRASAQAGDWRTLTINLPQQGSAVPVQFSIDRGNGGQPQKRDNLSLDAETGEVAKSEPFSSLSAGRQARSWIRFLHTGEALGVVGQTIAGLASLAAAIMAWTGLALSLRRFSAYLARTRKARAARQLTASST